MAWFPFIRRKFRAIEARREFSIEYLGEKTGPTEDEFKTSLEPVLQNYSAVERAYLAIITTDEKKTCSVALCLAPEKDDQKLVREVGEIFHRMFGESQFLDIMFLSDDAESEIQKVCLPFYTKKNLARCVV